MRTFVFCLQMIAHRTNISKRTVLEDQGKLSSTLFPCLGSNAPPVDPFAPNGTNDTAYFPFSPCVCQMHEANDTAYFPFSPCVCQMHEANDTLLVTILLASILKKCSCLVIHFVEIHFACECMQCYQISGICWIFSKPQVINL